MIEKLEKKAALQTLLLLYNCEKASRTDLRNNIKANIQTIYSALEILKKLELIEEKTMESFPFTVYIYLTERGRRVAELLSEIEAVLKDKT